MRLLERIHHHSRLTPGAIAYRNAATSQSCSYAQLFHRAATLAHRLRNEMPPESVVMICCPNSVEFAVAFVGTLAAGCAAFPISIENPTAELRELAQRAGVTHLISSDEIRANLPEIAAIPLADLSAE